MATKPEFTDNERYAAIEYLEERGIIGWWTASDPGDGKRWEIGGRGYNSGYWLKGEAQVDAFLAGQLAVAGQIGDAVAKLIAEGDG